MGCKTSVKVESSRSEDIRGHCVNLYIHGKRAVYRWGVTKLYIMSCFAFILSILLRGILRNSKVTHSKVKSIIGQVDVEVHKESIICSLISNFLSGQSVVFVDLSIQFLFLSSTQDIS